MVNIIHVWQAYCCTIICRMKYDWKDDLRQFIMLHKNCSLYFIAPKLCSSFFSTLCSVLPLIPTRRQHAMNINNSRTFFHDSVQWISFLSHETITYRQFFPIICYMSKEVNNRRKLRYMPVLKMNDEATFLQ